MPDDAIPWDEPLLTPERRPRWWADVASLRDLRTQQEQYALHMGDRFNELKARWGEKMPELARAAGVPYHAARQRAQVAAQFPPDSRYRAMGLPFSILRLLAALPQPRPWAEKAKALQALGQLRVRDFTRMLEEAGERKPRPRKIPRCLHCGHEVGEDPDRLFLRRGKTAGWLCSHACVLAFLQAACAPEQPTLADPSDRTDPSARAPCDFTRARASNPQSEDAESQNRDIESQNGPRESQFAPPFRNTESQNGRPFDPVGDGSRAPPH